MKKMLIVAATFVFAAVMQVQAMNLNWGAYLVDDAGGAANEIAGYVELVMGTTVISSASGTGSIGGSTTFWQTGPVGTGVWQIDGGTELFFRIYNATTAGAATEMITTDMWTMPTFAAANDNAALSNMTTAWMTAMDGLNGYIDMNDTRWTVVPEPTSMALLAFGAAALGLRRKFRK